MRVFYDHQVFSLQDAGGVSRYQYELIRNLQLQADPRSPHKSSDGPERLRAAVCRAQESAHANYRLEKQVSAPVTFATA